MLAVALLGIGLAEVAGWWLGFPWLTQISSAVPLAESVCFIVLGILIFARIQRWAGASWLGLIPAAWGAVALASYYSPKLNDLLAGGKLDAPLSGRTAAMTGYCLMVSGLAFAWHAFRPESKFRIVVKAIVGSMLAAVAFSTLFGYAANLPAIYRWGGAIPVSPMSAAALALIGAALLIFAWNQAVRDGAEVPAWAPLPAVIGCLTLTFTLWVGLRERELAYLDTKTQQAMESYVQGVNSAIERQIGGLERIARNWSDLPQESTLVLEADATTQMSQSGPIGCVSIARVDPSLRTRWVFPQQGNEAAISFDHSSVPARRAAIEQARSQGRPAISGTVDINGTPHAGFVIYGPLMRSGQPAGYVAAEYIYKVLFSYAANEQIKLGDSYHIGVSIGGDPVYDGGAALTAATAAYTLDKGYTLFDRRLHMTFTPSVGEVAQDRGPLPEFALVAGIGLAGLLGMTVHLAGRARAGQMTAEFSNRRLLSENEERRRVESRLKLSDERLRLALDSTEIGIFEWNVPASHVFYSTGLWTMFGYEPGTMPSTPEVWQSLIHTDDLGVYRPRLDSQLDGTTGFIDLEYRIRTGAGEWRWVYMRSKSVALDHASRPTRIVGTVQDVTARVESEHQLRRAKIEADAASRTKSEFLASMSHEIRTPMNGIIGMTSLIMETELSGEQRDYVSTIRSSSEALLSIVNDILDFSKIESGKMEIERMPFALTLCLEETIDLFAKPAAEKKLEIAYFIAPDVPAWITGDVTRLWQIVTNLINNAVKFTNEGRISIEVRRGGPAPSGRLYLEFTIRDTGIGIPADRMGRLFKAFSQVDSSTTRKFGGTGLGLAISERLCQLMGGTIRVESTEGKGSSFIFTILTEAAPLPADIDYTPALPAPLREAPVLCVEANPVVQARLRGLFEKWGAKCVGAPDAATAAELAAQLPVPPALLLVAHDPSDGSAPFDALKRIWCPSLALVPFGLTAISPADGRAFASVSKPLKTAAVQEAVIRLFSIEKSAPRPPVRLEEIRLGDELPLKVLLAEDNPVNQKVALGLLERLGYHADLVSTGVEALASLESKPYDLVLMDLQMPDMDGLEASRQIRRRLPDSRQPKIIALTANAMTGDRDLCTAAGMDDFLAKPVKLTEIAAAITRQFGKRPKKTPV